jgi:hypothetical protein
MVGNHRRIAKRNTPVLLVYPIVAFFIFIFFSLLELVTGTSLLHSSLANFPCIKQILYDLLSFEIVDCFSSVFFFFGVDKLIDSPGILTAPNMRKCFGMNKWTY